MLGASDEIVPVVANGAHIAELTLDHLVPHKWVATHNARLPLEAAMGAVQARLINLMVAILTLAHWQLIPNVAVHIDL